MDNVRPLSSVLKWLFFQFKDDEEFVQIAVEDAIDKISRDFSSIPYVKRWFKKHDKFLRPDKADALQAVHSLADHIRITKADLLFKAVDIGSRLKASDPLVEAAETELLREVKANNNTAFLVYGHTHAPRQVAMDVSDHGGKRLEQIYLNTGTLRTRHHEAARRGFITWKQLTYVTLYNAKETAALGWDTGGTTGFESWTGARKDT